jgi:hypothetical protein
MLGPNHTSYHMAQQTYSERLDHAAKIRLIQTDRHDDARPFNRDAFRIVTARRLAAGLASIVLMAALAAGTVGTVAASPSHASGGGAALIR